MDAAYQLFNVWLADWRERNPGDQRPPHELLADVFAYADWVAWCEPPAPAVEEVKW